MLHSERSVCLKLTRLEAFHARLDEFMYPHFSGIRRNDKQPLSPSSLDIPQV